MMQPSLRTITIPLESPTMAPATAASVKPAANISPTLDTFHFMMMAAMNAMRRKMAQISDRYQPNLNTPNTMTATATTRSRRTSFCLVVN